MSVTFTQLAAEKANLQLEKSPQYKGLRLSVKTTGCSGLAYVMEFVEFSDELDTHFVDKGVNIYIDAKSLPYLEEVEVDYIYKDLNEGFVFNNPKEKDRCGCGESFTI